MRKLGSRARPGMECPSCTCPILNGSARRGEWLSGPERSDLEREGVLNLTCPSCTCPVRLVRGGDRYGVATVEGHDHHYNLDSSFRREDGTKIRKGRSKVLGRHSRRLVTRAVWELADLCYTPRQISAALKLSQRTVRAALRERKRDAQGTRR